MRKRNGKKRGAVDDERSNGELAAETNGEKDETATERAATSLFCDFTLLALDAANGERKENSGVKTVCKNNDVGEELDGSEKWEDESERVAENATNVAPNLSEKREREELEESENDSSTARVLTPEEIADDILLSTVDGVGPLTAERLLDFFGNATEVLRASRRDLERVEKVGPTLARKISEARSACDVESLIRFCRENAIEIVSIRDARYPERLREIPNPPRLLYVRGEILPSDRTAIAVVGTRGVSQYGAEQTTRLTRELVAAGFCVVSGLALGVDGCAHRAALASGGRTLAVLGGGVAKVYPREHVELARRVAESGAVLSEYHPLTSPLAGNFPARNRIVAGLSLGVLVVESPVKSGALITARIAAEQNREVFAVPGPVDRPNSGGCHQLLREGAALVETVDDVLAALGPFARPDAAFNAKMARPKFGETAKTAPKRTILTPSNVRKDVKMAGTLAGSGQKTPIPANLSDDERRLVATLDENPKPIDAVVRESGLAASKVVGLIAALEFKKIVRRREGNAVSLR